MKQTVYVPTLYRKLIAIVVSAVIGSAIISLSSALATCVAGIEVEDFGASAVGGSGQVVVGTVSVRGEGNDCETTITSFNESGSNPGDFILTQGTPSCINFHLTATNSCKIIVTFKLPQTGARTATLMPVDNNNVPVPTSFYYGAGYTITSPQIDPGNPLDFFLGLPSPQSPNAPFYAGSTTLTFTSSNASIVWAPTLTYQTSGKLPVPAAQPSPPPAGFQTGQTYGVGTLSFGQPSPGASPVPAVAGGKLDLTAETDFDADNDPLYVSVPQNWITGIDGGICDASITNELTAIYTATNASWSTACTAKSKPWSCCTKAGIGTCTAWNAACISPGAPWACCSGSNSGTCTPATPSLFTLIATDESSYQQFSKTYANGTSINANGLSGGLWPYESLTTKKGQYIGLMQDALRDSDGNEYATPMDTAWNWLINAQVGLDIFNDKIGHVVNIQTSQRAKHSGLGYLTQYQIENMALLEYGGVANTTYAVQQYYTAQMSGGSWQWLENPTYQGTSTYVENVRAAQPPETACP